MALGLGTSSLITIWDFIPGILVPLIYVMLEINTDGLMKKQMNVV